MKVIGYARVSTEDQALEGDADNENLLRGI